MFSCAFAFLILFVGLVPAVIHPEIGSRLETDSLTVTFVARKQNYSEDESVSRDEEIVSPKSVHIHPNGSKYYVNSLEGMRTVVYDFAAGNKCAVVQHRFDNSDASLWAPESGLFPFQYKYREPHTFSGKPVESTFSHRGRYLWVPYYRRSFDINAQDPSAVAVIDTETDTIVRLFETGPLPKMITTSPNGKQIAVTHWGDNTVGIIDISGKDIADWHYTKCYTVDYKLKLNYSRTEVVNRDVSSGYCLRGTAFTNDGRYLLVGCMGGGGGIAIIDLKREQYLGRIVGVMPNLRHLLIDHGFLYASINNVGYVQRITLRELYNAIDRLDLGTSPVRLNGWVSCKVPAGARTIVVSPDGHYIFAACNYSSKIAVVDTRSMSLIGTVDADSYPVGLDISQDGKWLISTSQGRGCGGNAVDIFHIEYK